MTALLDETTSLRGAASAGMPFAEVQPLIHPSLTPDAALNAWCDYADALSAIDGLLAGRLLPEDCLAVPLGPLAPGDSRGLDAAIAAKHMEAGRALRILRDGRGGN